MRLRRTPLLCAAALLSFAQGALHAQKIQCVTPSEPANAGDRCTLRVPADSTVTRTITVQVLGPRSGNSVEFSLLSPTTNGSITPRAQIGTDGTATATWTGRLGDQATIIVAENRAGGRREIEVKPALKVTGRSLDVLQPSHPPHWFVQRQLRDSVRVLVNNPTEECSSNVVVFIPSPGDGTVSPDSVRPTREGNNACVATTWWTLGANVGRQHLRAVLADERSKTDNVTAIGRALPRLGAGLVVGWDHRSYQTLSDTTLIIKVTNESGGTSITRDSLVTRKDTSTVDSEPLIDPAIITDFPIFPSVRWLRGMVGVSARNPESDFYLGISALQPIFGVTREGVLFDMQLVMHVGRREILRNPSCTSDAVLDDCETRKKFFLPMGFGLAGFVDGSTIITTITSIFK